MNELAQELAVHLGLKNRKPYISTKVSTLILFTVFYTKICIIIIKFAKTIRIFKKGLCMCFICATMLENKNSMYIIYDSV